MSGSEKRNSERVVPMVSDEEMVVVEVGEHRLLAKMMDLSDGGTLLYLLTDAENAVPPSGTYRLSLYHNGTVFAVSATIARTTGRLIAFRFKTVDPSTSSTLQAKLIRMEVEWTRLQALL
jgi:hypothetical protein